MSCCPPLLVPFSNKLFVSIPYGENLQEQYGQAPDVSLSFFFAPAGKYLLITALNTVKIIANTIQVDMTDFGLGPITGFIKIY